MGNGSLRNLLAGMAAVAAVTGPLSVQAAFAARAAPAADRRVAAAGGPLLAWGDNQDGELGDGSMAGANVPVAVNPPADLRVISARVTSFGIAVAAAGQVWTWGRGQQGELGNGATSSRLRPVRVQLPAGVRVKAARAGFQFAVAVTTTGQVVTWGDGRVGELGNGHRKSRDVPVRVDLPRGVRVTAVTAAADSAFALTTTGRVPAWGDNRVGELGNGRRASTDKPVWVRIPRHAKITALALVWATSSR